jgi:RNA recognition motif-containing protein
MVNNKILSAAFEESQAKLKEEESIPKAPSRYPIAPTHHRRFQPRAEQSHAHRVFIYNLPPSITLQSLRHLCRQYGGIEWTNVYKLAARGNSLGIVQMVRFREGNTTCQGCLDSILPRPGSGFTFLEECV